VADRVNISLRSLSRLFARHLNISPARYLNSLRMERARSLLLLHPEKNVKEIAYELNFSSTALFSESFRKFYGAPPHAYRSHGGDPGKITEK
jgi:transcriptional regulator GlxA family with amidase domain